MKQNNGQSLTEYGLAIGLMVLMGIGGLALLGSQTSDLLGNMIGEKGRGGKNLAVASLIALDSDIPARADSMDLTIPVTTLDGKEIQITIKNYPTKMTEKDILTGDDGGTLKLHANLLRQLAQELFDKNVITEDQFKTLRAIADRGLIGHEHLVRAEEDQLTRLTKYQVEKKNQEKFCPAQLYDPQNPTCKAVDKPINPTIWIALVNEREY